MRVKPRPHRAVPEYKLHTLSYHGRGETPAGRVVETKRPTLRVAVDGVTTVRKPGPEKRPLKELYARRLVTIVNTTAARRLFNRFRLRHNPTGSSVRGSAVACSDETYNKKTGAVESREDVYHNVYLLFLDPEALAELETAPWVLRCEEPLDVHIPVVAQGASDGEATRRSDENRRLRLISRRHTQNSQEMEDRRQEANRKGFPGEAQAVARSRAEAHLFSSSVWKAKFPGKSFADVAPHLVEFALKELTEEFLAEK